LSCFLPACTDSNRQSIDFLSNNLIPTFKSINSKDRTYRSISTLAAPLLDPFDEVYSLVRSRNEQAPRDDDDCSDGAQPLAAVMSAVPKPVLAVLETRSEAEAKEFHPNCLLQSDYIVYNRSLECYEDAYQPFWEVSKLDYLCR